ncbi:MAG: hypothetical protein KatS3mg050_0785 [Litorilinea sp.]|nr:MAG: hypothetical protein KatS3mg050_0785 [Litorilinea sp.]
MKSNRKWLQLLLHRLRPPGRVWRQYPGRNSAAVRLVDTLGEFLPGFTSLAIVFLCLALFGGRALAQDGSSDTGGSSVGGLNPFGTYRLNQSPFLMNLCKVYQEQFQGTFWILLSQNQQELWTVPDPSGTEAPPTFYLDDFGEALTVYRCEAGPQTLVPVPGVVQPAAPELAQPAAPPALVQPPLTAVLPDARLEAVRPGLPVIAVLPDITLLPAERVRELPPWFPPATVQVQLTDAAGRTVNLQPDPVPDSWRHVFPQDSPAGEYRLRLRSGSDVQEVPLFVGVAPRVYVHPADSPEPAARFDGAGEVMVTYADFPPDHTVLVALFRVVPALTPDTLTGVDYDWAPVAQWSVQIPDSGRHRHRLTEHVPLARGESLSGNYLLLACDAAACHKTPELILAPTGEGLLGQYQVAEIRWPRVFHEPFAIAPPPAATGSELVLELAAAGPPADAPDTLAGLTFEVTAHDPEAGPDNGDGIAAVTLAVFDSRGVLVYTKQEDEPAYCALGGAAPCPTWEFAAQGYRWPGGQAMAGGLHTLRAMAATPDGRFQIQEWTVSLWRPPLVAHITRTGEAGPSAVIQGGLVFQVEALDPARGLVDGSGIEGVELTIFGPDGALRHRRVERTAAFCAFGGDSRCNVWSLAGGRWPDGSAIRPGLHRLVATVHGEDGRQRTVEQAVLIP